MKKIVVLAAGGTGGHLFPAQALAEELLSRGYVIHLITDERVADYGRAFPANKTHIVPSSTLSLSKPWLLPARFFRLLRGIIKAKTILGNVKPVAVVGFGGYPSFPPIMAASWLKIPTCVHDQNAVMGRANRVLSYFADAVASSFPALSGLPKRATGKVVVTGNPVRGVVMEQLAAPYQISNADRIFHLLVFGGSQGARFFAEFMPKVIAELPRAILKMLRLSQQCRPEDIKALKLAYEKLDFKHDLQPFFVDMPKRIAGRPITPNSAIVEAPERQITRWAAAIRFGISMKNGCRSCLKSSFS